MKTWRIQKDNLGLLRMVHSDNPISGRLGFIGHNGNLLIENTIQKRRFSDICSSNNSNKS
jgi:hypothetical protein